MAAGNENQKDTTEEYRINHSKIFGTKKKG